MGDTRPEVKIKKNREALMGINANLSSIHEKIAAGMNTWANEHYKYNEALEKVTAQLSLLGAKGAISPEEEKLTKNVIKNLNDAIKVLNTTNVDLRNPDLEKGLRENQQSLNRLGSK